jgi:hypothetical protein
MDMHHMPAEVICLAIAAAAVTVPLVFGIFRASRRLPFLTMRLPSSAWTPPPRAVPARAGPIFLRLQVVRR